MLKGVYLQRAGRAAWIALACALLVTPVHAQKRPQAVSRPQAAVIPSDPDEAFTALREAARKNDVERAYAISATLVDYPVPSYVEYFRIKPQLFDASGLARIDAPDDQVRVFLQRYKGDAIADRMRNDWLLVLGKKRDWANFDVEYPQFALKDDTQVECYALLSRALKGQNVAADARNVLSDPRYYGEGCVDLIGYLAQSQQIQRSDVAYQARLALEQNYVTLAGKIAALVPDARADGDTLATIVKMARSDPSQAAAYLGTAQGALSRDEQGAAWGVIGQFAARKLLPDAAGYYRRQMDLGGNQWLSDDTQEWRVRAALRQGDWKQVRQAVELMRPELRAKDPAWIYWYGRALKADGRDTEAQQNFQQIAGQFNFYGQLASEELGNRITLPARTTVSDAEAMAMRSRPGFQRAQKFYNMNLRFEGNREWNWELRNMSDRELLAAAEYARRLELLDRTVNSADRTRNEHDFTLRFLMPYRDIMQRATDDVGLDMAWVYGLIRQESRFIMNARSSAGAHGLMQVMPATAKYVARKIGMNDFSPSMMGDPNINILLGTNYLNMVLTDLDSSWTLASAAYNAGPGRPKAWRSTLVRPVEGAIFAETIPFNETRGYVKNVLSNATYYAALMSGRPQSLKSRLGMVAPSAVTTTSLP
ncbi:Soluble lytic murein transglycosylase or regulatory protein s (may containing LysM/invasin domain) [Cupriavidus necator]|uniref:Lytic transglycosylase domain-containing protein n=1 Tax=Cupriavidus necator (strain ATCC 17699 / DSM 428 / KCTC 22496 / NCIMB 10442 / H16 / Stanier 337) TaxID=381666 RepID=Q0KF19_CUPNH|nr:MULTISPECIES: lytic transglycosylase domain-containing protein [Cupriavidus]EON17549.1 soluble lytic murein transglycosylase [Cupriavidus sp. GA3-3]QCB99359.1 lytic transglycosylase domain-containing protein [Cupriavidus necator H16]QQB77824.1 lytic transglycosylase domain-containing protein [Cupriavidus necator]WKA41187.1 transglycosylase SLT domain-containing protein [Cupriavidus necator]CAJ91402.1 soluble lytic murein transglycosylase [Cupriavidus necator H16]